MCRSSNAPPAWETAWPQAGLALTRRKPRVRTAPKDCPATVFFSHAQPGENRMQMAGIRNLSDAAAARIIFRASETFCASGFSQRTCLPALSAAMVWAACFAVGVQISTKSTAGSAINSSNSR